MSELLIRPMRDEDRAWVLSAWLHSLAKSPLQRLFRSEGLPDELYWRLVRERVTSTLAIATTLVAERPDGLLAGSACVHHGMLEQLYVRLIDRQDGVARQLLQATGLPTR